AGASEASTFSLDRMRAAGSLQEMGSLAAYRAMEGEAQDADQMNKYAQFFLGEAKSVLLAKVDKIPGVGTPIDSFISGQVLEAWFPTDHELNAVKDADLLDINLESEIDNAMIVARVGQGDLPPEALRSIQEDGSLSFDLDGDGATSNQGVAARFDLDGDGRAEALTEQELEDAVTRRKGVYADAANDYLGELRRQHFEDQ
ncbi:MAG: hypothetical protein ACRDKZ_09950, partial [Actinomycetota bacterium]